MELLSIENINTQYLSYENNRTVVKWLRKRKISVIKLGKMYFVSKTDFENEINNMLNQNKTTSGNIIKTTEYKPITEHDKKTYSSLLEKMSEV